MSVYVDEMSVCVPNKNWRYKQSCHLVADTVEELHYFAGRMRLNPAWFQGKPFLPHYDLTMGKRNQAIRLGAVALNRAQFFDYMRTNRPRKTGLNYLDLTGTKKSNLHRFGQSEPVKHK